MVLFFILFFLFSENKSFVISTGAAVLAEGRGGCGRGKWGEVVRKSLAGLSSQFEEGSGERRRAQGIR